MNFIIISNKSLLRRNILKKISSSLNLGIVGNEDSGKEIFINYLKSERILDKSVIDDIDRDHFIVFKQIPIKIRIFLSEDLDQFNSNYERSNKFDVLIITLNINNLSATDDIKKEKFDEFRKIFSFWGVSILVGIDVNRIFRLPPSPKNFRLSKDSLIKKAKDLDVLYCFEIKYKYNDLKDFFNMILEDFLLKINLRSPELYDQAKFYGTELISKYKIQDDK